jgi:exopolysaccharide biosynthesis polyprenyl glycosylphosphotransferase
MLKERADFIRNILYVVDLFLVSLDFFLLYWIFLNWKAFSALNFLPFFEAVLPPEGVNLYLRSYWVTLLIWAVLLRARGGYKTLRIHRFRQILKEQSLNGLLFFGFFTSAAFLLKFDFLSRMFIIGYSASSALIISAARITALWAAREARNRGVDTRDILLIGTGRRAQEFLSMIARHREWGYRVIGLLDKDPEMVGKKVAGYTVMGTIPDLPTLLETHVVDEVVIVVPRVWLKDVEPCVLYCEAAGVPATLSTDFFELEIAKGIPREFEGWTYLTFETSRLRHSEFFLKRLFDIIFSSLALILLSPVFLAVAIAVRIGSPGPVFFGQLRCGKNRRPFKLYKFRSMIPDAEAHLEKLRERNEMSGPVFKMEDDPRLTKIGKFIRKTSLDELPQFWNVLKGDMSLVGPRPPLPKEVEQYQTWQRRRLSMKPGITCIWQVSGRNNIDFEDWMKLDLQYIDHWSLWLDLKIILLTAKAVLMRSGAK